MTAGLDAFVPRTLTVTVRGRTFNVAPVPLRRLPAFTRAVVVLLPLAMAGRLLDIIIDHADTAREMVTLGLPLDDPAWLDDLLPDEFLALVDPVLEANLDFFVNRTLPGVRKTGATIMKIAAMVPPPSDGAPSSPSSPDAATVSTPA